MKEAWRGFTGGEWTHLIDVRDFIQKTTLPMKEMNRF